MFTNQIDLDSRWRKSTAGEIGYYGTLQIGDEDDLKTTLEICDANDAGAILVKADYNDKSEKYIALVKTNSETGEIEWDLRNFNSDIEDGSFVRFEALDPNTNLIIAVNKYINYASFWNDFIIPKTDGDETYYAVYVKYTGEVFMTYDGQPEERYVFAVPNNKTYPELLDTRVFIDGELIGDVYEERHNFMEYLYIPKKYLVKEDDETEYKDSYIEIEVFPSFSFSQTHTFTEVGDSAYINIESVYEKLYYVEVTITYNEKTISFYYLSKGQVFISRLRKG
jgi:hypothetical protein